ncbi:hypothetical protein B0H17DRAFT_1217529 [Mycena rosella]|uniref:Uncharacterized protein n=1 Tax=Mycena rosella TaxID=1033263 RepID=A0AAD7BY16_MYCRO|nr:hypothetical protein B0H17DRAFT_1217529 [Mycena rosella]
MSEEFWEDNNSAIKYSSGQWARAYGSIYHGAAVMRTRHINDSMSVKFRGPSCSFPPAGRRLILLAGSAIKFMGAQGWDHGSFLVNLDGEETVVDGYCCAPNGGVPQVVQFEANGLNTAEHVLNVTNLAAGPRGTALEVDAVIVTPHPGNKYITFAICIVILALVFVAVRRCLVGMRNWTTHQMLALSSAPSSNAERIPSDYIMAAASNRVRPDKAQAYADEVTFPAGGSDASGSGSSQHRPAQYFPVVDTVAAPEVDDALVERIAQRLARLVRDDAPPTYENTTAHVV